MKTTFRRMISLLVIVVMVFGLLPAVSFAENGWLGLTVATVSGSPGDTVNVTLNLSNNPGIASLKFNVNFDDTNLALTDVVFAEGFGSYVTAPTPYKNPQTISLVSPLDAITTTGLLATLKFTISEDAADDLTLPITITYDADDVFDPNLNNIALNIVNGAVRVYHSKPGDINGDDAVNNKDAIILFRYVAGWSSATVSTEYLDINGDGKLNNKDAIILFRHIADPENVPINPIKICLHATEATAAVAPSCTSVGNIAFWHCTLCGKYFSNSNATTIVQLEDTVLAALGHDPVIIPAVAPTNSSYGSTEGSKCNRCGSILVAPETIDPLARLEHTITYDIANGDTYLQALIANGNLANAPENTPTYQEGVGLSLKDIAVAGYRFAGWFDGATGNATQVKKIDATATENYQLYAHWEKIQYTITFDNSSMDMPSTTKTYTVDENFPLDKPTVDRYVFLGWTTDKDELVTEIKAGTIGSFTLHANWTSKRNLAKPVSVLGEPLIIEDTNEQRILFAYEIGQIENVPLYTLKELPSAGGVVSVYTETMMKSISATDAKTVAASIDHMTTDSTTWTLSEDWNETTHIEDSVLEQHGYDRTTGQEMGKTSSNTYTLTSEEHDNTVVKANDGTVATTTEYDTTDADTRETWESKASLSVSDTESAKYTTSAGVSAEVGASYGPFSAKVGASMNTSTEISSETTAGASAETAIAHENTTHSKTGTETVTVEDNSTATTTDKGWNKSSNSSSSSSTNFTTYEEATLSEMIAKEYTYGESYAKGGSNSQSAGSQTSRGEKELFSSTFTYFNSEEKTEGVSYTISGENDGSYRLVRAGLVHVFAVVIYDIATAQYTVATYNVLDDITTTYIDYSATSAQKFDDNENGVLPFEVPIFVNDYVNGRIVSTEGLDFSEATMSTAVYSGSETSVIVPEFISVDNQEGTFSAYTIRSLSPETFSGKTEIKSVLLSNYIREIPDSAFAGCTSLEFVYGSEINRIGSHAFDGCENLGLFKIPSTITEIGEGAFSGVDSITVTANSKGVVEGVIKSGAKKITINISAIADQMSGITLEIPSTVEYFELQGGRNTFSGLKIKSEAETTVLNGIIITDSNGIPLEISSEFVTLNQVIVESPSYVLLLKGATPSVSLYGTCRLISSSDNAVVCRNVTFKKITSNITAKLEVTGDLLYYGTLNNSSLVSFPERGILHEITSSEYEQYIKGCYTVTFNANGGTVDPGKITAYVGAEIGTLPAPAREGFTFDGWFTDADGGVQITAESKYSAAEPITAYAHWTVKEFRITWNTGTGYTIAVTRTSSPYGGAATTSIGRGAAIYYGDVLNVTYTAATGYTLGSHGDTAITVAGDVSGTLIYASASPNSYTYSIVYRSSNGTNLGSSSATKIFGTTNTIYAPDKAGYNTPSSQTIAWDATSKTITFTYSPRGVDYTYKSGTIASSPSITYSATLQYQNRTANSVQVRVVWTATIGAYSYTVYGQKLSAWSGSASTSADIVGFNSWGGSSSSSRSSSGSTGWMTIGVGTTNATSVSVGIYYYQTNSNGTDMTANYGEDGLSTTWTVVIPAY